jgi:hypothetical protein
MKDYTDTFIGDGLYTHARNAVNNSHDGQVGIIGNEPSNILCVNLPYTMIGCIHLTDDQWVIFTTDDINSEIGIFDESDCSYKKLVNSSCLNFKKSHLITGAYRKRFDCERLIYWDDGVNPTRTMDIDNVPYIYTSQIKDSCEIKTYTDELDCQAIRMSPLLQHPCIKLKKDVFESEEFQAFAEANLVLVRADFPRLKKNQLAKDQQAKNDALAERYNHDGKFPLTVLLNEQGKVLKEWDGYQPSTSKMVAEIQHFR